MESFTNVITVLAGAASSVAVIYSLWRMFRTPETITVTRKDNGKTIVINTRAGWREGSKLANLL